MGLAAAVRPAPMKRETRSRTLLALAIVAAGGIAVSLLGSPTRRDGRSAAAPPSAERAKGKAARRPSARPAPPKSAARGDRGASPARSAPQGEVLVRAEWGSEPGKLGHRNTGEAAPEGPMSFAKLPDGSLEVLDQVNARLQIWKAGEPTRVIPLPSDTYEDMAVDPRGGTVVLDRLATGTVTFVDPSGRVDHSIPIAGAGVTEPGGVTGVFARADGVWIEVEHQSVVRIADANGEPDASRPAVPGRFAFGGAATVSVAIASPTSARLSRLSLTAASPPIETTLSFSMSILGIHALEMDGNDRSFIAVNQIEESEEAPFDVLDERETVIVVDARGAEVGRVEVAPPTTGEEQRRPIRVDERGNIYELRCGKDAATIERFAL